MASLMRSFSWLGVTISFDFGCDSITALVEFSFSSCKFGFKFCFEMAYPFPVNVAILFIMKAICLSFSLMLAASISMLFAKRVTCSSRDVEPIIITVITFELVLEAELCRGDEGTELSLE